MENWNNADLEACIFSFLNSLFLAHLCLTTHPYDYQVKLFGMC